MIKREFYFALSERFYNPKHLLPIFLGLYHDLFCMDIGTILKRICLRGVEIE
jgi:hypothetical protein